MDFSLTNYYLQDDYQSNLTTIKQTLKNVEK